MDDDDDLDDLLNGHKPDYSIPQGAASDPSRYDCYKPGTEDHARAHGYVQGLFRSEAQQIIGSATRNHDLNRAAFKAYGWENCGAVTDAEIENAFLWIGRKASINGDFPDSEIRKTLRSARQGATQKNLVWTLPPAKASTNGASATPDGSADASDEDRAAAAHQVLVEQKAYDLQVYDEAKVLWTRRRAASLGQEPAVMESMDDFLAVPDEPAKFRVDELLPVGGRALLAAQYKTGKTSMVANLLRSLVDGDLFLGRFHVDPVDRVLLIDTELDKRMLRHWLRDQNIRNQKAINVLCLRGKLSAFDIVDDRSRAEQARIIAGAEFIVLDCLRPCIDALGLSEDKDAGRFLTAFDALCHECGASEAVVVHHMGHNSERARGDSRLLDWPDVLWKITRRDADDDDGDDVESGDRFFSAMGRDVLVPEAKLDWEPHTRVLTLVDGNRSDGKASREVGTIIDIMAAPEAVNGYTQTVLIAKLRTAGVTRNVARAAVRKAVRDRVLLVAAGPRDSQVHTLNPSWKAGLHVSSDFDDEEDDGDAPTSIF